MADYTDAEIRQYIREVVSEAKKSAHVDTGYLKRSIRGALVGKGKNRDKVVEFREVFYGAYNDNSKLSEIAQRIMPNDLEYRVIYEDEDGNETTVKGKTRTGRKSSRSTPQASSVSTTQNIRNLINSIKKLKSNGEKKDSTGEGT